MNTATRRHIDSLASEILTTIGEAVPIECMDNVVERLGGRVEYRDFLGFSNDGELVRDEIGNGFTINVPSWQSPERRKFTIAHELGHLFLHMGYLLDNDLWEKTRRDRYYRRGHSDAEQEANEFAAAFLMPQEEYESIVEMNSNGNTVDILKVAQYFMVSVDAATYRGKWLGVLNW